MKRCVFFISLFTLITIPGFSQPGRVIFLDSIQQEITKTSDPKLKVQLYLELAGAFPPSFADSIHVIARMLPSLTDSYHGLSIATVSDYLMGMGHMKKRNLDSSHFYMKKILPDVDGKDHRLHVNALSDIAIYFGRTGRNDSSIHYLRLAQPLAEEYQPHLLRKVYGNLGIAYQKAKNYTRAIAYFEKVFALPEANKMDSVIANLRIGDIHMQLEDYPEAVKTFKAVARQAPPATQFEASSYNNTAAAFSKMNMPDSSLHYLNLAYSIILKAPDASQLTISNRLITANEYLNLGLFDEAAQSLLEARNSPLPPHPKEKIHMDFISAKYYFKQARFDSAVFYSQAFLTNADQFISPRSAIDFPEFFELIADSYAQLGNFKASNEVLQDYVNHLRNTEIRQSKRELADLKIFYETQEKEKQLQASQKELAANKKINWLLGVSILAALLALISIGYTFRSVKAKNKLLEAKNEKIQLLIRELHHRVKNNLQVISSLLGLQSIKIKGDEAKLAFEEGKSRVNAMAMIHKKLYQEENLEKVNIHEYLEELVEHLKYSFAGEKEIDVALEVDQAQFNMDKAIPVGLILNELITNSFKYAFEDIEKPLLEIKLLQVDGKYNLSISDNGKRLEKGFDIQNSPSFGLKLVHLLVEQIHGSFHVEQSHQLKTFSVQFA